MSQSQLSSLVWSIADLLRGDYRKPECGRAILPFTVLRRLDCVLVPTKAAGLHADPVMRRPSGAAFYNASRVDMRRLTGDHYNIGPNLLSYVERVSYEVRDVFDRLAFTEQIHRTLRQGLRTLLGAPVAQGNFLLRQPLA